MVQNISLSKIQSSVSDSLYSSCSDRTLSKDKLGYTVIYHVFIGNTGSVSANNLIFTDILPLRLQLVTRSPQGTLTTGGITKSIVLTLHKKCFPNS